MNLPLPSPPGATERRPQPPRRRDEACTVRVFGVFAIEWRGQTVAAHAWRRVHARRLLKLLATAPNGFETRQRLQLLLWPEFDDARARNRLHHTVHWVRQALLVIDEADRPKIVVRDDRFELVVPAPGSIDCVAFRVLLETAQSGPGDAAARLALLGQALSIASGELAPEWQGCDEMDTRRRWWAERREEALQEAVALARELGDLATAVRLARQHAAERPDEAAAQTLLVELLAEAGQCDAALLHGQAVRGRLADTDAAALPSFDAALRGIQRVANVVPAGAQAGAIAPARELPGAYAPRLQLAAPREAMIGYESLLQAAHAHLLDPYAQLLTLAGPPGCGKSTLAAHVVQRRQSELAQGAWRLDAGTVTRPPELIAAALEQWRAATGDDLDDEGALCRAWAGRQMLLWVDDLTPTPALAEVIERWLNCGAELQWLITAWSPLRLRNERTLRVDSRCLLSAPCGAGLSPAAAWLARDNGLPLSPAQAPLLERLAAAVDGLPSALQVLAERLQVLSPQELLVVLAQPGGFLAPDQQPSSGRLRLHLLCHVQAWLLRAGTPVQEQLRVLARCRSELTRDDLLVLLELQAPQHNAQLDAFVEYTIRHHYLWRRTLAEGGGQGSRSVFAVHRVAALGLQLLPADHRAARGSFDEAPAPQALPEAISLWIEQGPPSAETTDGGVPTDRSVSDSTAPVARSARWFDERAEDIDAVCAAWQSTGQDERWLRWCARHAGSWVLSRAPLRTLAWLNVAVRAADERAHPALGMLLVERARLRTRVGRAGEAADDARRALLHLPRDQHQAARAEALAVLEREAARGGVVLRGDKSGALGVQAGEDLLRVALVAVRSGRLPRAVEVCQRCAEIFAHFGATHALTRTHLCEARIAFGAGDFSLTQAAIERALAATPPALREGVQARVELLLAEIDLAQERPDAALRRCSALLAHPQLSRQPGLVAHGLRISAWAHGAQQSWPLAQALGRGAQEQAARAGHVGLLIDVHLLAALCACRTHDEAAALPHLNAVAQLVPAVEPLTDLQGDLIVTAELAFALGQDRLAVQLAAALNEWRATEHHQLRPWVERRLAALPALPSPALQRCEAGSRLGELVQHAMQSLHLASTAAA